MSFPQENPSTTLAARSENDPQNRLHRPPNSNQNQDFSHVRSSGPGQGTFGGTGLAKGNRHPTDLTQADPVSRQRTVHEAPESKRSYDDFEERVHELEKGYMQLEEKVKRNERRMWEKRKEKMGAKHTDDEDHT